MAVETRPGSTFAGYLIVGTVGRGGMGVVYRARELALDRPVALKLIAPELASDPAFRERFLEESRIAASLDHASILPVYAAGEAEGELYLATRYVEGTDLRRLLAREGPLSPERALRLVGQIAEALDAAHRRGLVHRDVKPGNVLVDTSEHCYLCDFGLTKQLVDEGTSASDPLAGSLDYLAPEQIRREEVDGRTDQYALACVLYECLAGSSPFRRETQVQTLWAHLHQTPPPLADLPALDPVLARALGEDPAERYTSCSAFVEDARSALGLGASPIAVTRKRSRIGRRLVIGGAALLVAAVTALTLALTLGGTSKIVVSPYSVAAIDPESGKVVAGIPVGVAPPGVVSGAGAEAQGAPTGVAASENWVWVIHENAGAGTISKIDASSQRVVETFSVTGTPVDLLPAAGSLWVSTVHGHVFRIDPSSDAIIGEWTLPNAGKGVGPSSPSQGIGSLAYGDGAIWASSYRAISRIDAATSMLLPRRTSRWGPLAFGFGSVWVLPNEGQDVFRVVRLSPETLELQASGFVRSPPFEPRDIAVGEESIWVPAPTERLQEIDPRSIRVANTYDVGGRIFTIAAGSGAVWATTFDDGVVRFDQTTGQTQQIRMGGQPIGIAVGDGFVWVAVSPYDL